MTPFFSPTGLFTRLCLTAALLGTGLCQAQQLPFDSLLHRAEAMLQRNSDSACQMATFAREIAATARERASAQCLLGYCATIAGQPVLADSLLHAALDTFARESDLRGLAMANNGLGQNEMVQGHFGPASDYFFAALDKARQIGDKDLQISLQNNIGAISFKTKQYQQALTHFLPTASYFEANGDSLKLAIAYSNIGTVLLAMATPDDFQHGVGYLLKAYQIKRLIGDIAGTATSYYNLAQVLANRSDYSRAISSMHHAMSLYREMHNPERLALTLSGLADLYIKQGNPDSLLQARLYLDEALSISTEGNFLPVAANAFSIKARLLALGKDYPGAIAACEAASRAYHTLNDTTAAASATLRLAELNDAYTIQLMEQHLYADAVDAGNQAVSLFEQLHSAEALLPLYKRMAEACRKSGDKPGSRAFRQKYQQLEASGKSQSMP